MPSAAVAGLTVAATARRLGVAPPTLRTWARRYGLGPTAHVAGSHRRYGPDDIARLELMHRLTLEGVPAADAARVALAVDAAELAIAPDGDATVSEAAGGQQVSEAGQAASAGRSEDIARSVYRAAVALDAAVVSALVLEQVTRRGVVPAWNDVLVPVLVRVGERWARTGQGVEVEHLVSECVLGVLRVHAQQLPPALTTRAVLLACVEEEQHSLPIHALSTALAERRVLTRVLGARVPRPALAAAIRRSGPRAVFLWSQLPATVRSDAVRELPAVRPPPLVALGGVGWGADSALPRTAFPLVLVSSMAEAVEVLASAVRV